MIVICIEEYLSNKGICQMTKHRGESYNYNYRGVYAQTIGFPLEWIDGATIFGFVPTSSAQSVGLELQ